MPSPDPPSELKELRAVVSVLGMRPGDVWLA